MALQVRLLDSVDSCLVHPTENIQTSAAKALSALMTHYFPVSSDIDYYQHKSTASTPLPTLTGWKICRAGSSPAPTLEADGSKTPFCEEHNIIKDHQLGHWITENNIFQHALESANADAVDISVELIRAAGRNDTGVYYYVSKLLHGKAVNHATPGFPSFAVVEKIFKLYLEEDQTPKECIKLLADAVMTHLLKLNLEQTVSADLKLIEKIRNQLSQMCKRSNEANQQQCDGQLSKSLMTQEYFNFRQAYALKLVTSNELSLALLGWDEINSIIIEIKEFRPPPKSYIVTTAGTEFINGRYDLLDDGSMKPNADLIYHRRIALDDANQEIAGRVLILSRRLTRWYLSLEDSEDQSGSMINAVDYYRCEMKPANKMPKTSGWSSYDTQGVYPPPKLKCVGYATAKEEKGNTFDHRMAKWAIENDVVELALGTSATSEVIAKSKGLMKFLAKMLDREDPSDFPGNAPNEFSLSRSHLLTAEKTCVNTTNTMVLAKMQLLLLAVRTSIPEDLKPFTLTIVETIVLRRIELNDPTFLQLQVASNLAPDPNDGAVGWYAPKDGAEHSSNLVRLGHGIGSNTHLTQLYFNGGGPGVDTMSELTADALCEGLKQNESIEILSLADCNLSSYGRYQIFDAIAGTNNNALVEIGLWRCELDARAIGVFGRCSCLKEIDIYGSNIDTALIEELVQVLRGCGSLMRLNLSANGIGRSSCNHIASLLGDPECNIEELELDENQIDTSCMINLASALFQNTKLQYLSLGENGQIIDDIAWDAICQVLCNTLTINDIFSSNHTLKNIECYEDVLMDDDLLLYLRLNENKDKRQVAKRKILHHYKDFDMKPFFGLGLKMLPVVLAWLEDVSVAVSVDDEDDGVDEEDIGTRRLSVMYQFTRAMPMMVVPHCHGA